MFGFALTGYLLPWDQKGYWATQVATGLLGALPLVGPWLKSLLQGGPEYGNLTLTRFFTLHALVLPAITIVLAFIHVKLFRRHGVTPGWRRSDGELDAATQSFWPDQLVRDFAAMAVVLGLMLAVVVRAHGVGLEAPADPASAYDARPEWYFLPLYQLLKYFPGRLEIVGALGAPLVVGGLLFLLPLLDRGPDRRPGARKRFIGAVLLVLAGSLALGAQAEWSDRKSASYRKFRERADREAARALELANKGVPPAGGTAVWQNDPVALGRQLYADKCSGCHLLDGQGERKAPDLDGWSSRKWIRDFLLDPESPRFYGATKVRGMKPVKQRGEELEHLVEWIYAQGGREGVDEARARTGGELFVSAGCDECHDVSATHPALRAGAQGTGGGDGTPDLGGRATPDWIRAFVKDPAHPRFFDRKSTMTRFAGKLDEAELDAVVALLRGERAR
jgi:ubiquinol-cytochrome c reductase cytochrome b subunit